MKALYVTEKTKFFSKFGGKKKGHKVVQKIEANRSEANTDDPN